MIVLLMLPQILCNTCCGSSWQIYTHVQSFPYRQYLNVVAMLLPQILSHTCCTSFGRPGPHFHIRDNFELWDNFDTTFGPDIDSFVTIGKFCTFVAPSKSWSDNTCCLFGRPRPHFHIVGKETGWC